MSYQSYKNHIGDRPTEERIKFYRILDYLKPNHSLLDIGCNSGFFSVYLASHCKNVVGVDSLYPPDVKFFGEVYVEENSIENIEFIKESFLDVYLSLPKYDVILALALMGHIKNCNYWGIETIAKKLYDLTNDNGILFHESITDDFDNDFIDYKKLNQSYIDIGFKELFQLDIPTELDGPTPTIQNDDGVWGNKFSSIRKLTVLKKDSE